MNFVERFLDAIERKLVLFAATVTLGLYFAYIYVHEQNTRPSLDFVEQLIPNLAATFVLFVGSYLFLKEINRLRDDHDREQLSDAFAAKVLQSLRYSSHQIGLPERRPDRQHATGEVLQQSLEIWLMGKTLSFFVSQNKNLLIEKLRAGARLRFLILAPDDTNLLSVVSRTSSQTSAQLAISIQRTVSTLRTIKCDASASIPSGQTMGSLEVRFSKAPFNNGYTFVDPEAPSRLGKVFVEYFGIAVDLTERLSAVLPEQYDPDGFRYHREQFMKLWNQATSCTL